MSSNNNKKGSKRRKMRIGQTTTLLFIQPFKEDENSF